MTEPRTPPRAQISNITSPTAYHGAAGMFDDRDKDAIATFQDIRSNERTNASTQPSTPTTLGSRLLSGASSLARSGSTLHSRTRSWVPKLNNNNNSNNTTSSNSTPERRQPSQGNKLFNDLFSGESAPVRLGVPTASLDELEDSEFVMEHHTEFTPRPLSRRKTSAMSVTNSASKSGPKSWFGRKEAQPAPSTNVQDEILNININNSLFPHGPADPLSPHAFNDLLLNATALLERMQTAYKEKVEFLESIRPEMEAQKEEVAEAQTRADHLKMQLEDLGQKAEEQKQVNLELVQQIAEEKVKTQEFANTIRLVNSDAQSGASEESRRGKRRSAGSAADSGFESDTDRDTDVSSILSSGIQTPLSMHQPQVMLPPENIYDGSSWNVTPTKLGYERVNTLVGSNGNKGAWETIEHLRHENAGLRTEVESLKHGLQGVIDFVSR